MMRKCHLNTCPTGVATQDEKLRANFTGKPENVVNYMQFVAEEVREIMAKLGVRTFKDLIGNVEKIQFIRQRNHWKARGLDFTRVLNRPISIYSSDMYRTKEQKHGLDKQIDNELLRKSRAAIDYKKPVKIEMNVINLNRSVGTMLSGEVTRKYGLEGLPEDTIEVMFTGTAGQSFGAFLVKGITFRLVGEANDYVGKGLCGGKLIIQTPAKAKYNAEENILIGNTCFYGATSGIAFIHGLAGERFCVRNSGAVVVVEGVGDHGCEYMTGGRVVVLGAIGRNFAAGMSGGIAYIYNIEGKINSLINQEMVDLESFSSDSEKDEIQAKILDHYKYTGSQRAKLILENWEKESKKFIRVIPRDYKKALEKENQTLKKQEVIHG